MRLLESFPTRPAARLSAASVADIISLGSIFYVQYLDNYFGITTELLTFFFSLSVQYLKMGTEWTPNDYSNAAKVGAAAALAAFLCARGGDCALGVCCAPSRRRTRRALFVEEEATERDVSIKVL